MADVPYIEPEPADPGFLAYVDPRPVMLAAAADAQAALMNPYGSPSGQNAAGTNEDLALHVALIVAFSMIGVYVLRASGFEFAIAGSVG